MQFKKTSNSPTSLTVKISLNQADLQPFKKQAVQQLGSSVKLAGFRPGKAPLDMLEKNIDPSQLQTEVLENSVNHFYAANLQANNIRPVSRPEVEIKKFVPFTLLEFEAKFDVIGEVKLPDYKKIRKARPTVSITVKDIDEVLKSLRTRMATKSPVTRAAKLGDEATIGFKGVDDKGQPVSGAEGKDYPLLLGSNAFIPGFEDNLVGLKAGDTKTFDIKFPTDYGVSALASKKLTFTVDINQVQELVEPKLDDAFAAQAGPFKTLKDLKADIKKQLTSERQAEADRKYEGELVEQIASKSKLAIPDALVEDQLDAAEKEERQNLAYRGQTWEEHLKFEGVTEAEHRAKNRPQAEARVKAGLVLSEISEQEKLDVDAEELDGRIKQLKGQYQDAAMQAELDKPENRRDIAARILTEKTVAKLVKYATAKK